MYFDLHSSATCHRNRFAIRKSSCKHMLMGVWMMHWPSGLIVLMRIWWKCWRMSNGSRLLSWSAALDLWQPFQPCIATLHGSTCPALLHLLHACLCHLGSRRWRLFGLITRTPRVCIVKSCSATRTRQAMLVAVGKNVKDTLKTWESWDCLWLFEIRSTSVGACTVVRAGQDDREMTQSWWSSEAYADTCDIKWCLILFDSSQSWHLQPALEPIAAKEDDKDQDGTRMKIAGLDRLEHRELQFSFTVTRLE